MVPGCGPKAWFAGGLGFGGDRVFRQRRLRRRRRRQRRRRAVHHLLSTPVDVFISPLASSFGVRARAEGGAQWGVSGRVETGGEEEGARGLRSGGKPGPRASTSPEAPRTRCIPPPSRRGRPHSPLFPPSRNAPLGPSWGTGPGRSGRRDSNGDGRLRHLCLATHPQNPPRRSPPPPPALRALSRD